MKDLKGKLFASAFVYTYLKTREHVLYHTMPGNPETCYCWPRTFMTILGTSFMMCLQFNLKEESMQAGRSSIYIYIFVKYTSWYLGLNPSPNQWGVCKSRVFAKVNTDHNCINWNSAVSSQSFHCSLITTRSCEVLTWDVLVLIYIHAHLCRK